jgi:hypothetical protein
MAKPELTPTAQAIWMAWWESSRPFAVNELGVAIRAVSYQGRRGPDHWNGRSPDDFDKGWDAAMDWVAKIAAEMDPVTPTSEGD